MKKITLMNIFKSAHLLNLLVFLTMGIGIFASPPISLAIGGIGSTGTPTGSGASGLSGAGDALLSRACKVISYFYTGIIIVSVGCFLYAAWLFLSKAGKDSKGISDASQAALWAVVGLAIAMVAMGVPALVGNFLDVSVDANPCAA